MSKTAWASLFRGNGRDYDTYKIMFNSISAPALDGIEFVTIKRSSTHIVLEKMNAWDAENSKKAHSIYRRKGKYPEICMQKLVNKEGFLSKDLFDGRRCKVKRDKSGRVYICLTEVVKE